MDFKGTKGKWHVLSLDDTFIHSKEVNICEIPHNGLYNYDHLQYNALIISKAPEMLDMLKKCYDYFMHNPNSIQSEENAEAIDQLIKEATELQNNKP